MSVSVICGPKGSGKSYFLTNELYDAYKQRKIVYCNYGLKFPFRKITMGSFLHKQKELQNCVIGIDEAMSYLDCRRSMDETHRVLTYHLNQSRKFDVDIYFATLDFSTLDKRLRDTVDYVYKFKKPLKFLPDHKAFVRVNGCEVVPDFFNYVKWDFTQDTPEPKEHSLRAVKGIFNLYDTKQFFSLVDYDDGFLKGNNKDSYEKQMEEDIILDAEKRTGKKDLKPEWYKLNKYNAECQVGGLCYDVKRRSITKDSFNPDFCLRYHGKDLIYYFALTHRKTIVLKKSYCSIELPDNKYTSYQIFGRNTIYSLLCKA